VDCPAVVAGGLLQLLKKNLKTCILCHVYVAGL